MRQSPVTEIRVARQQGRFFQAEKKRDNIFVADPLRAKITRDGPKANSPWRQQVRLVACDVFVQDVYAATASSANWPSRVKSARRAS